MIVPRADIGRLVTETFSASLLYLTAFVVNFELILPIQNLFFPEYTSRASLLFLPHGVRVLAAWLMGWRSTLALLPGVFLAFFYVAGPEVFTPSRLAGIFIAVTIAPAAFEGLRLLGVNLAPRPGRMPCWICIMLVGLVASVAGSMLTNLAFGSAPVDYFAYVIGDMAGLFFLMLALMLVFRWMRRFGR